ncbi:MAG TPA: hypothetical protein VG892_07585 [Terriglobales bacterium]|nr:hypothetical protein [Terriglobales bacterium]
MIHESRLFRDIAWIVALILICAVGSHDPAFARPGHGGGASTFGSCPQGTANATYDGCLNALSTGTINTNLLADYVLDASGNPATIQHDTSAYNVAGKDFPVGPPTGQTYTDPADMSFSCSSCSTNGTTTLTITTISGGGHCVAGEILWQTSFITDHPKILSCGSTTAPTTATLDKTEATHSGQMYASTAEGCYWKNNGGYGTTAAAGWSCDFRAPNNGVTADFSGMEWGAVGGHPASMLRVAATSGTAGEYNTIKCWYCHYTIDSNTDGTSVMSTSGGLVDLDIEYSDLDGGNDSVPVGSPASSFVYAKSTSAFNWAGACGQSGTYPLHETIKYNYIHGWAGNESAPSSCNAQVTIQANYYLNNGANNGDTANYPGATGLHGSWIGQWQNSTWNAHLYWVHLYNNTVAAPYGFRYAATTALAAILAGHGTNTTIDEADLYYNTWLPNVSSTAGKATVGPMFDPFQLAGVTKMILVGNRWNDIGATSCAGGIGGDMNAQNNGLTITTVDDAPNHRSTLTVSGEVATGPIFSPGQYLGLGAGSSAISFYASMSGGTLSISGTIAGNHTALPAGTGLYALGATDPIYITGGSGESYTVNSSQTIAAGTVFTEGYLILPPGTDGTTGSTSSVTAMNGTWRLEGDLTSSNGYSYHGSPVLGNGATAPTDWSDNYDLQTAGSGGAITYGPMGASCPNTSAT